MINFTLHTLGGVGGRVRAN